MRSSGPSHRENILGEIKQEYEHLSQTNETLRQENDKLQQVLELNEKYLQAVQQRIEELKQEVDKSKDIAVRMQNWEGRLAACEQYMAIFKNHRNKISDLRCVQTRVFKQKSQDVFLDVGGRVGQRAGRRNLPKVSNPRNRCGNDQWNKRHRRRSFYLADEAELCARFKRITLSRSGEVQ